jgi:hypothetical protein
MIMHILHLQKAQELPKQQKRKKPLLMLLEKCEPKPKGRFVECLAVCGMDSKVGLKRPSMMSEEKLEKLGNGSAF